MLIRSALRPLHYYMANDIKSVLLTKRQKNKKVSLIDLLSYEFSSDIYPIFFISFITSALPGQIIIRILSQTAHGSESVGVNDRHKIPTGKTYGYKASADSHRLTDKKRFYPAEYSRFSQQVRVSALMTISLFYFSPRHECISSFRLC